MTLKDMTPHEQVLYRSRLFRDAIAFRVPERTPHFNCAVTWKIIDAGYKYSEAFNDYAIMEKCVRRFCEIYPFDLLMDNGARNPFKVIESFGKGYYYYDDDSCVVGVEPYQLCPSEDLVEYAKNPDKYLWEKTLPAKFPDWDDKGLEDFQRTMDEQFAFNNYSMGMMNIMRDEYGIPFANSSQTGFPAFAIETMFTAIRGIKGLALDIRRNGDALKEAVDIIDQNGIYKLIDKIAGLEEGTDPETCYDISSIMLAHTVLSPKSFERYYYDPINKLVNTIISKKKQYRITVEGAGKHLFDYFRDYPQGTLAMLLEQDDIYECREALPNVCLIGGMETTMLNDGTVQECLDWSKKLIDELTPGFIFGENKFISYKNDANAENFKAVCDFVASYMNNR